MKTISYRQRLEDFSTEVKRQIKNTVILHEMSGSHPDFTMEGPVIRSETLDRTDPARLNDIASDASGKKILLEISNGEGYYSIPLDIVSAEDLCNILDFLKDNERQLWGTAITEGVTTQIETIQKLIYDTAKAKALLKASLTDAVIGLGLAPGDCITLPDGNSDFRDCPRLRGARAGREADGKGYLAYAKDIAQPSDTAQLMDGTTAIAYLNILKDLAENDKADIDIKHQDNI